MLVLTQSKGKRLHEKVLEKMKNTLPSASTLVITVAFSLFHSSAMAQDWPQWRGPMRDGTVTAFNEPNTWPSALTKGWSRDVGLGYATPLLVGEQVFMFTRENDEEVMQALNAATGETLWRTTYPAPFAMNPATAPHREGPKSTPAFSNGRLFTLGITGIVSAFDASTGQRLWHKPAPPVEPLYHTGMSPLVVNDLVILHVGGHDAGALTAFDVASGDVRWEWEGDGPAYGSPRIFEFSGTRQIVTFSQEHFVGVSLETGTLLWQRPFTTSSTTTSQTPLLYNDTVIETGRGNGITAFRVTSSGTGWTTQDAWHTDAVSLHMANAVVVDGVLVGLSHLNSGQYFGLDLDSGELLWTSPPRQADHASIVKTAQSIFSLEDDAELVVLRHSRNEFEPVVRYEVAESETWAQPTLSGNRFFIKDVSSLTLWTVD